MNATPTQTDGPRGPGHPAGSPPEPRAAGILRFVAVLGIVAAVLVGIAGIWRAQTSSVSDRKYEERQAHARAYSQLAGNPSGPGAARVEGVTVTDARIQREPGSAAGRLAFTVFNSGPAVQLRSVTATLGAADVSRVLYASRPDAEPQPLPARGLSFGTGARQVFTPDGRFFALIGLPTAKPGERARVTATFTGVGDVTFEVPVLPASPGR